MKAKCTAKQYWSYFIMWKFFFMWVSFHIIASFIFTPCEKRNKEYPFSHKRLLLYCV